jgi:hypothetical protein
MKKFFSLVIAAAFVFGTIGCDDKKPSTPAKKTEETKKTEENKDGSKKTEVKPPVIEEKKNFRLWVGVFVDRGKVPGTFSVLTTSIEKVRPGFEPSIMRNVMDTSRVS